MCARHTRAKATARDRPAAARAWCLLNTLAMSMCHVIAACCVVACAGCLLPESAEVEGSGVTSGEQVQSVSCGPNGTIDRYLAGDGEVSIKVTDGEGHVVYEDNGGVSGEVNDSHGVAGWPGSWTFDVDPGGFAGQLRVSLQCYGIF